MTINSIERVDKDHIKIMATPDASALSDEILSVKVDDQHTFVCMNDPSEVAFSLSPDGEGNFIDTPLSLINTPFLVDEDLLFFFIRSQKVVANPSHYAIWEYTTSPTDESNTWVLITDESQVTTIDRTEYRFDINVTNPTADWSEYAELGYTIKVVEKEALDPQLDLALYYNEEVLYNLVYNSLRGILNGKRCCDADYNIEGRLVILIRAFEIALRIHNYREAIRFWTEIHADPVTINQPCHCNG